MRAISSSLATALSPCMYPSFCIPHQPFCINGIKLLLRVKIGALTDHSLSLGRDEAVVIPLAFTGQTDMRGPSTSEDVIVLILRRHLPLNLGRLRPHQPCARHLDLIL